MPHTPLSNSALDSIADSMALLRGTKYIPEGRPAELYEEHLAIVQAIKNRDPEAADEAAQGHVRNAYRTHLRMAFAVQL